jgi:hypothetical protein
MSEMTNFPVKEWNGFSEVAVEAIADCIDTLRFSFFYQICQSFVECQPAISFSSKLVILLTNEFKTSETLDLRKIC